jgi:hypothetical protein
MRSALREIGSFLGITSLRGDSGDNGRTAAGIRFDRKRPAHQRGALAHSDCRRFF